MPEAAASVRSIRSTAASSANVPPPQARVLERLEVADADGGLRDHGVCTGRGEPRIICRAHGLEAVGELEAGVPLADDEDALALVIRALAVSPT